jgi:CheY-like chemotaxis protein
MNILIVDDSKLMRELVKNILSELGYVKIHEAMNGMEAIEKVQEIQPEIVFMNLIMPEMDGYLASQEILTDFPGIKIIIMSSSKEAETPFNNSEVGIFDYIRIPFGLSRIKNIVKNGGRK